MKFQKNPTSIILIIILCGMATFFVLNASKKSIPAKTQTISENIGGKNFSLEIASNQTSRELGLGQRNSLAENGGMIFVFDKPGNYGFWMKDTKFPLDIIWLNDSCVVVGKATMTPESFPKPFYPDFPAVYAIELQIGSTSNIKESDILSCVNIKNIKI